MTLPLYLVSVITLLISLVLTPLWIKRARSAGLVAKDMHKIGVENVSKLGGITVIFSFFLGVLLYVALRVFLVQDNSDITLILALLCSVLVATIIGFVDDILGWKIGLSQWQKPLLTLIAALPLMAVDSGTRIMSLPFLGSMDLGLLYPLLVTPAFIAVGSNGTNMLAGYNGLEASLAMMILTTLSYLSWQSGATWVAVVSLIMVAAIFGFWLYNKYPAKVFPGDTFTYSTGASMASIAILANLERSFVILFVPFILEFFLKLRGRFKKESFAAVREDGLLEPLYPKNYGLEHIALRLLPKLGFKAHEQNVVRLICCFQFVFIVLALLVFVP